MRTGNQAGRLTSRQGREASSRVDRKSDVQSNRQASRDKEKDRQTTEKQAGRRRDKHTCRTFSVDKSSAKTTSQEEAVAIPFVTIRSCENETDQLQGFLTKHEKAAMYSVCL